MDQQLERPNDPGSSRRLNRRGVQIAQEHVTFSFDGRSLKGIRGESLAAALAANGIAAIRRSDVDAGWRGLYCGMGACYDCAVMIDGRVGQRACLHKLAGGEEVHSALPVGNEQITLRALTKRPEGEASDTRAPDILVIGAGPAGLAAALAARRCGATVTILDGRSQSGGQYFKPIAPSHQVGRQPDAQFRHGEALLASTRAAGVEIFQEALVWGAFATDEVMALVDGEAAIFRPRRLILATGAFERAVPFEGWTLPGVMTAGAAQTLARAYQVAPGQRVLIAGNGPLTFQLADDLVTHGVEVVGLVERAPTPDFHKLAAVTRAARADFSRMAQGFSYLTRLKRARVPIYWAHDVVRASGDGSLAQVEILPVGGTAGDVISIAADTLCLGHGLIASSEIARALGCSMTADERHIGSAAVATDENGETSIAGVFAVGDGARVDGADIAGASGRLAGLTAAAQLGLAVDPAAERTSRQRLQRANRFQQALWQLFEAPPVDLSQCSDKTVLCRCEGLDFGRVRAEITDGASSLGVLKRRTRLGMGRCQGRYCTPLARRLLRGYGQSEPAPGNTFAPRLPVKPFPVSALLREKPEWGGHQRAGSPDLARPVARAPFESIETDNLIIGAGVIGACLAYELGKTGQDVVVIDRDDINLQASGANAGSLHVQLLSFDFGNKAEAGGGPAAATLPLGPWAVHLWQQLAEACDGDFEIRITGGLMVAESETGMRFLREKAALERRYGIEAEILGPGEIRTLAPALSPKLIGAEYAPQEGKINPLTATFSVMDAARRMGVRFEASTNVQSVEKHGKHWRIETSRGRIKSRRVINAAGPWARQIGAMVGLDVPVYSAPLQMIVTDRAPKLVDQLVAHADRHLSLKQLAAGGIVIGGAWTAHYDERINMNVTIRESIEGNLWVAQSVLPQLDGLHVLRSWAGMNVNIDGAPIIGEAAPGFFNAVTSNGYTLAPAVARLTAQLIEQRDPEFDIHPYLLDRFS